MKNQISISACEKILNTRKTNRYSSQDLYAIRIWLEFLVDLELDALEKELEKSKELNVGNCNKNGV
ncbi:MAG: hypothetical protein P8O16_04730 [Algoriphagus sp.]|uniref:hypothetical protein n=1 Tax=Algoriphagus sp. TaxID=1872435 RepID=UPI002636C3E7|nr:hypothetical protein [Algoriphagus sp.]MDG1276563.1 hypothetical protein [Algoriphagus sp.]